MVPRVPLTTGTVQVVLSPHIHSTSISKSLYLLSFSVVLTEVLVSRGIAMSMKRQVLSFLFFSIMSGLSSCYGPFSVDGHVPQNIIIVIIIIINVI